MNEKVFITAFTVLLFMCAVVLWFSFRKVDESNRRAEDIRVELQSTAERLQRAEERNRELENRLDRYEVVVSDAAERLGELNSIFAENNGGLHSTIERLQRIAEEVSSLEARLRDIDSSDSSDHPPADLCIQ